MASGGLVYHVLNRANGGATVFETAADYAVFEQIMGVALRRVPMRILAYCVMPNHWHLVLWPRGDGELSQFVGRLSQIHTQRRHYARARIGSGHLYQSRFKACAIESDERFLTACRYVERNPLRAGLVSRAEDWRWSSLSLRHRRPSDAERLLSAWPVPQPEDWLEWINQAETPAELDALRTATRAQRPLTGAVPIR